MGHETSRSPLLHVLDLGRFAHVLFVRHDLHDVRDDRLVTIRVLLARIIHSFALLFIGLPDACNVAYSLIPVFLLASDVIDLFELLGGGRFKLFEAEWIQL